LKGLRREETKQFAEARVEKGKERPVPLLDPWAGEKLDQQEWPLRTAGKRKAGRDARTKGGSGEVGTKTANGFPLGRVSTTELRGGGGTPAIT